MANQAVRVPEPSVESSSVRCPLGCDYGGRSWRRWHYLRPDKLGTTLGHVIASPWSPSGSAPTAFGLAAGIWLIVTQWLASGLGGYLAGRLREKWVGIRTDEVLFRDTAHGFLAWALATLIVVTLLTIGSLTVAAAAPATTGGSVSPEAAEAARKAGAAFAFFSSLSLLIGAFIASVAGGLGGFHRDEV